MMELWDVYDRDRIKTGRTMVRGNAFLEESYHLVIHVCVFNSKGEMLIQQRQPFKKGWPNMWDVTVGGSAIYGDSSQIAAERELFEEIGLKANFSKIRPHLTMNFEFGFDDYYLIEAEVEIDALKLQFEEVQRVKWATKNEIIAMLDKGDFVPYYKNFIELIFDMRKKYGVVHKYNFSKVGEVSE